MRLGQRGWSHFSPGQVVAAKTTCVFSFPSPCPAVWMRDVLGTPLSSSEAVPKLLSRSSTRGWEGCCCQLSLAATRMRSVQAGVMLCGCEGPQCPHLPVPPPWQGLCPLAGLNPAGAAPVCAGWLRRGGGNLLTPLRAGASSVSGGNPVRSPELHVGQSWACGSASQAVLQRTAWLGCIFYTLLNRPFLKSQGKLSAKAHDQGDICLP